MAKIALITGGSRGIGLAIAQGFAAKGFDVVLIARNPQELAVAAQNIPRARTVALDVTDALAFTNALSSFERVDVLVNAAGVIEPIGSIEKVDAEQWLMLLKINVFGTFVATQASIPMLSKAGGTIINFVGGGEGAFPNFSAYAASKGAIARLTETAAAELKDKHITVNAIAPGAVNTKMTEDMIHAGANAGLQYEKALKQKETDASPEKAVKLALWLASDEARSITGKIISAQWDDYEKFPEHLADLQSDLFTMRRITPRQRGDSWGEK